jgi:hypothetical protein
MNGAKVTASPLWPPPRKSSYSGLTLHETSDAPESKTQIDTVVGYLWPLLLIVTKTWMHSLWQSLDGIDAERSILAADGGHFFVGRRIIRCHGLIQAIEGVYNNALGRVALDN